MREEKPKPEKKIKFEKSFLVMEEEDLKKHGILGWRLNLINNFLRTKPFDVFLFMLIVLYSLLIILYFVLADPFLDND